MDEKWETYRRKKLLVTTIIAAALVLFDNEDHMAAIITEEDDKLLMTSKEEHQRRQVRRAWSPERSDINWFNKHAAVPSIRVSPVWKAPFRVSMRVFDDLLTRLQGKLRHQNTHFRPSIPPNIRLAACLMYKRGAMLK